MQLLVNGLIAGSLLALIASGLSLVYGILGVFNLALGQLALCGGYAVWWLHISIGLPLFLSIPLGTAIGGIMTWACFETAVAPFYRRHRLLPLVTTIALGMILDAIILLLFEERPRAIIPGAKHILEFAGLRVTGEQIVLVTATAFFILGTAWMLHATVIGRRIRATVQHPEAARSLGINAPLLHRMVFAGSGILASLGGIYLGIDQSLTPTLAFPLTIKAYAALIAGGKDNVWGTILMSYIIALLEQLLIGLPWAAGHYLPAGYQSIVALLFIIGILLLKPTGLFSSSSRTT